ncbi:MAG TPA: lysophospholipid acyltransferase family protein [Puia sp.]|nr:lysophospholipid acyltransferase family protein [Puia sp.]
MNQPEGNTSTPTPGASAPTPGTPNSGANPAATRQSSPLWTILGPLWAVWVILLFTITMLLFLPFFLLFSYFRPDPQKTTAFASMARIWMAVFLPLAGSPLRVRGREKFAPGQTYIVVCNHNALLDVPISYPGIPGGNKTIAKIEMARIPLFGMIYRTGSVLVDRHNEASRRESFSKMKEALDMGLHMCIYPEGTRNKTADPLKSFHDGAFRLALNTGKPILPAIIFNTRKVMPPGKSLYFHPHRLYMRFLDPITPQPGDTVETLKQQVFKLMWENYTAGPQTRP